MKKRENMKDKTFKHFNPMALREKYGIGSSTTSNPFSSFWAGNDWDNRRTEFLDEDEQDLYVNASVTSARRVPLVSWKMRHF